MVEAMTNTTPPRPHGVAIQHGDGTHTICELTYKGTNEDGYQTWETATPFHPEKGDTVTVDHFPENTTIVFASDHYGIYTHEITPATRAPRLTAFIIATTFIAGLLTGWIIATMIVRAAG